MPTRDEIQAEAIEAILREWYTFGRTSTLLQMPTQTGKTRTAAKLFLRLRAEAQERGVPDLRMLILNDRSEIINQWAAEFHKLEIPYAIEKGELKAKDRMQPFFGEPVQVCIGSKDSFQKGRLAQWPPDFFSHVVPDECDLALSKTWLDAIRYFSSAKILGLTATIDRLDGRKLSELFESTAYVYRIEDAIANGHRVPYRSVKCDVNIDIRSIKPERGKLPEGQLEAALGPHLEELANVVRMHRERLGFGKAVAFLPGGQECGAAYLMAQIFRRLGIRAEGVHHKNPERGTIVERFKRDDFDILCNTGLTGRGFSDPKIDAVIHLRPTLSRALYDQMSGRCGATREGKEFGYLLFPCWETDLELVGPTDIFAEHYPERVRKLANELAGLANKECDPQELLAKAQKLIEKEEEREAEEKARKEQRRLRFEAQRREVKHRYQEYDPIKVAAPWNREACDAVAASLSPEYVRQLAELGIRDTTGLSDALAPGLIRFWTERKVCGMSSQKQVKQLVKMGMRLDQAMDLTGREASRAMGGVFGRKPAFSKGA